MVGYGQDSLGAKRMEVARMEQVNSKHPKKRGHNEKIGWRAAEGWESWQASVFLRRGTGSQQMLQEQWWRNLLSTARYLPSPPGTALTSTLTT